MNAYKMTDSEWFKQFDETSESFKWFIVQYFYGAWDILIKARHAEDKGEMIRIMGSIWFLLPDNKFNIMENLINFN